MADDRSEDQTWVERFVGGSVTAVFVRLLILSAVVGFVLAQLRVTPWGFYQLLIDLAHGFASWLRSIGMEMLVPVLNWIGIGALVVVPIWLVARIIRSMRSR